MSSVAVGVLGVVISWIGLLSFGAWLAANGRDK